MEQNDVKRIVFECLDDNAFVDKLKLRLFRLEGLRTQADYDDQVNRIHELEREKQERDNVVSKTNSLRSKALTMPLIPNLNRSRLNIRMMKPNSNSTAQI